MPITAMPVNPVLQQPAAEANVIGCALVYQGVWRRVRAVLEPSDFFRPTLQAIARALDAVALRGAPTDVITVADELRQSGQMAQLAAHNGEALLAELANQVTTADEVGEHALIIRRTSLRREQARLANDLVLRLQRGEDGGDLPRRLEQLRASENALGGRVGSVPAWSYGDLLAEAAPTLIPSCLEVLNAALGGGYQSHSYVVLNGPTKHGKSSFALMEARFQSEVGRPVLVVSVEMRRREILSRLISQRLRIAHQQVNRGLWDPSHQEQLREGLAGLQNLHIIEFRRGQGPGVTLRLEDVFDEVKRLTKAAKQSCFVVLDYSQRLLSRIDGGRHEPRQAIGLLSDAIAEATRELGACFLVLSAIPRHMYGAKARDKSDDELVGASAEGGGVEYDAAAVLFLSKVGKLLPDRRSRAIIRVSGQRYDAHTGEPIRLIFDGAHNLFEGDPSAAEEVDPLLAEILDLLKKPVHRLGLPASKIGKLLQRSAPQVREVLEELVTEGKVWRSGPPRGRGVAYRHTDYRPSSEQLPLGSETAQG